jgi:hypothetical protein
MVFDTKYFKDKAGMIHGGKYDYSESVYVSKKIKVSIRCKEHGVFHQTPEAHYTRGCPDCSLRSSNLKKLQPWRKVLERLLEIHGDRYDYDPSTYTGVKRKITAICKEHGGSNCL